MSTEEPRRFARPDEVDYALKQDMGQGYTRKTVQISALGRPTFRHSKIKGIV